MSSRWISTSFSGASPPLRRGVDRGVHCLDQRRLAHAARAPQKHVVGGQAGGETLGVVDQDVAHAVDAADQADVDAVDAAAPARECPARPTRRSSRPRRDRSAAGFGRRQAADRLDQPVELFGERFHCLVGHFESLSAAASAWFEAGGAVTQANRAGKAAEEAGYAVANIALGSIFRPLSGPAWASFIRSIRCL